MTLTKLYENMVNIFDTNIISQLMYSLADALRDYETLSLYAQLKIPAGARLIGKLATEVIGVESKRSQFLRSLSQKAYRLAQKFPTLTAIMNLANFLNPTL
jgi:hypothetical protein